MYTYVSDIAYSQHILTAYNTDPQHNAHSHTYVSMRHWALRIFAQGAALQTRFDLTNAHTDFTGGTKGSAGHLSYV